MTRLEQLMLQMGIDNSQVAAGMNRFEKQVADGAKKAAGKVASSFRSAFSGMMGAFSVAGLTAQLGRVAERVEKLGATAAALQVSPKFLQDLENVGRAAGVGAEKVGAMLGKFAKDLEPGEDLETAFYAWADSIAAIEDPAERAQAAMARFGEAGVDMLKIAGEGSAALKELASGFATFSETDIAAIKAANLEISKLTNQATVFLGKLISIFGMLSRVAGYVRNPSYLKDALNSPLPMATLFAHAGGEEASAEYYNTADERYRKRRAAQAAKMAEAQKALAEFDSLTAARKFEQASPSEKLDALYARYTKATRAADRAKSPAEWLEAMREAQGLDDQMARIAGMIREKGPAAASSYARISSAPPAAAGGDPALAELRTIRGMLAVITRGEE